MRRQDLINEIGDLLTQIDSLLADPGVDPSSAGWQQLYALRKHLDDYQRELVMRDIETGTPDFASLAARLKASCDLMDALAKNLAKINQIIQTVAEAAGVLDQILKLV